MKKIVLKISGMHCTSCAMNIDGELEDTKGIQSANTNYAKAITEVTFNPDEIKIKSIAETIKKLGYKSKEIN